MDDTKARVSFLEWIMGRSKWTFGLPRITFIFIPSLFRLGHKGPDVLLDLIIEPLLLLMVLFGYYLLKIKKN